MVSRTRRFLSILLSTAMITMSLPVRAVANIYDVPEDPVVSATNPGDPSDYDTTWREGWGNSLLPAFEIKMPSVDKGQSYPIGAHYFLMRPASMPTTPALLALTPGIWADAYNAPISSQGPWKLNLDVESEALNPSALYSAFGPWIPSVSTSQTYEGPMVFYYQMYAENVADMPWVGPVPFGVDVTPPVKVTGLSAYAGITTVTPVSPTDWLTQSRTVLKWDDVSPLTASGKYDELSGTGYFEAFMDGRPYVLSGEATSAVGRRVYDLREHYPAYGFVIPTDRQMTIEDLPAGTHTLQVRAVDRATNAGPLSDPITIRVDPDRPNAVITLPLTDGETLGALPSFEATASDMGGVARVTFSLDTTSNIIATDTAAPYTASYSGSPLVDGSTHTLHVTATDMAGRTRSTSKTFVVDNKPDITMLSPSVDDEWFSPLVPLRVQAMDKTGIDTVVFRVGGSVVQTYTIGGTSKSSQVTALVNRLAGSYATSVTVTNVTGGSTTVSRTFNVDPSVRPDLTTFGGSDATRWFNTSYPSFSVQSNEELKDATQLLYRIDRVPMTTIDVSNPTAYDVSYRVEDGTTYFNGVIDQVGVYLSNPALLDGSLQMPGAGPVEGIWYQHSALKNAAGASTPTSHTVYGIDLTAPSAVPTVTAHAFSTATTTAAGWLAQTRAVIRWRGGELDGLSGTDHYNVYLDGEKVGGETGGVPYAANQTTMSITFEDLTPGLHQIEVSAVDRAGNEGPRTARTQVRITSKPKVAITAPESGTVISKFAPISASASDAAGISRMEFSLAATDTYAWEWDYADAPAQVSELVYPGLDTGDYTLTVTAYSVSGPTSVSTRSYRVDGTLPPEGGGGGGGGATESTFVWHNTPFPSFDAKASSLPSAPTEVLYLVDRSAATSISPLDPNAYYASFRTSEGEPHMNGVIDQMGVYLSDPGTFDGRTIPRSASGASSPIEGWWYIHMMVRNAIGEGGGLTHLEYGVDVTPPPAVQDVAVYADNVTAVPVSGWLNQNRVVVRWDGVNRDALSGTKLFRVYVDGTPFGENQGEIGYQRFRPTMSLTIEDLPSGTHDIQVSAVDEAGNEGALSAAYTVRMDTAGPTTTITVPESDMTTVGARASFAADASDDGDVSQVRFYVDATLVGTSNTAPYQVTNVDLSAFSNGVHTLYVEATDAAGHVGPRSARTFVLDKNPRVTILTPETADQAFSRLVPLKVYVYDPTGIDSIIFSVDGVPVETILPAAGTTTTVATSLEYLTAGTGKTFTARVTNDIGTSYSAARSFSVSSTLRPNLDDFRTGDGTADGSLDIVGKWFNVAYPTFTAYSGATVPDATELLYAIDRSPSTAVDPTLPNNYYSSFRTTVGSTEFNGVIDQYGVYLSNPAVLGGAAQMGTGINDPIEGVWYTHAAMRDASGRSGGTMHAVYGIDLTAPAVVTGVAAYDSISAVTPTSSWLDQTRAVIKWNGAQVDALSGVDFYRIYLDGDPLGAEQGVANFQPGRSTMALTIEDLGPGLHTVNISAVDHAGNEGPKSATAYIRIKSTPTINITSPASAGATMTTPAPLRALVTDPAGIDHVTFSVTGTSTVWTFPGSMTTTSLPCSTFAALPTGTYTLTVTAYSNSGSSIVATRGFGVDASLPPVIDPGGGGGSGTPTITTTFQWFNTAYPTFDAAPSDEPTDATELLYLVDRTQDTPIDSTIPNSYYASFNITDATTHLEGVIDQQGVFNSNPAAFDGALQFPGRVTSPLEGVWYIHARMRNALGEGGGTAHVGYGIDLTKPSQVTGVQLYASVGAATPITSGWLDQSRVVVRWDGSQRDALSGTSYYKVYVDGVAADTNDVILYQPGRATMSLTIEDLTPGRHTIEVTAVDKAGNESIRSVAAYAGVDSDLPEVGLTSPVAGATFGLTGQLSAAATDNAGVRSLTFYVDGRNVGTVTASALNQTFAARVTPDWTSFDSGTHSAYAIATDAYGHQVASTPKTFFLDKNPPVLSSVTGGPSPFYPRKRDGYKDDYTVKFYSNEAVTAKLTIKNSRGTIVRTVTKVVPAGSNSIVWNGKYTSGSVVAGTFRWTLQLSDAAGNKSGTKSGYAVIKFYQVIRTGTSSVRIVAR